MVTPPHVGPGLRSNYISGSGLNNSITTATPAIGYGLWIKTTDTDYVALNAADGAGGARILNIGDDGSGHALCGREPGHWAIGAKTVIDGTWNNIFCFDNTNSRIYLYVDGVLDGTHTYTSNTATDPVSAVIGKYINASSYLTGIVDDVRIYNPALSATEIKQLYNAGR
jgi:hypothetical protein